MDRWFCFLSGLLLTAGCCVTTAHAAQETELKDETGRTIIRYIVEAHADVAPPGTTSPATQMYAIGKSVHQDYREAGKWFLTADEAGETRAATNYVGSLRSGMGNLPPTPNYPCAGVSS